MNRATALLVALARVVADFVRTVFVDPVRDGRLRVERWPAGLAPVWIVGLLGYAVAVVAVLAAGPVRAASPLVFTGGQGLSLPEWAVGPLLALVVLALAFAQTAALHVPAWLGVTVTVVSSLLLIETGAWGGRGDGLTPAAVVSFAAAAALWVLYLLRRRRRFAWGEFAAVFAVLAVGIGVATWQIARGASVFGLEVGPMVLTSVMQSIGTLAFPAAVAAGAAVAQLSCTVAIEAVASARRHLPGVVGAVLLVALVAWRVWVLVADAVDGILPSLASVLAACGLLAVIAGGMLLLARLRRGAVADPAALADRFITLGPSLAVVLTVTVVPAAFLLLFSAVAFAYTADDTLTTVLQALGQAITTGTAIWVVRLVGGLALVGMALRQARRGRTVTPELMLAAGVAIAWTAVVALSGATGVLWTGRSLTLVVTVGVLLAALWWLVRRAFTPDRAGAVGTALLIAALFDQRTFVEDPLQLLLGFTGLFFVLFGFVWAMLTGGDVANGHSHRYPRASRVLLFLANALFGVTVLAFAALARDPGVPIDLEGMAGLGDQLLGTGLLAAVLVAALAGVVATTSEARAKPVQGVGASQRIG
ncbi:hypothetical protein [Microbacterium sp. GXF7504]